LLSTSCSTSLAAAQGEVAAEGTLASAAQSSPAVLPLVKVETHSLQADESSAAPHEASDGALPDGAASTADPEAAAGASALEPADLAKTPILQQWQYNSDGSLSGRVYGKRGFKEGEAMNTSIVPPESRFEAYVVTGSGSIYRLGEQLVKGVDQKALRRNLRDVQAEEAASARASKQRGAAAAAKEKMSADSRTSEVAKAPAIAPVKMDAIKAAEPSVVDQRSPRERKRPGSLIIAEESSKDEVKRPRGSEQPGKAVAEAPKVVPAPKAAPTAAKKESGGPDRPKHPYQDTKMHEAAAAAASASQPLPTAQRKPAVSALAGKHPNQYTYRQQAPSEQQQDRKLSPKLI